MNRRKFLCSGSLAIAAVAGLPKAIKARPVFDAITYRTAFNKEVKNQWIYEVEVDHHAVEELSQAEAADKKLTLHIAWIATDDPTTPIKEGVYSYIITGAARRKENNDTQWILSTKFEKKISGNHTFDKNFPKNPKMELYEYEYINILGKDNKTILQELPYVDPSAQGEGCFLTNACVQHMQLADDCGALQTLRSLRDGFMKSSAAGRALVKEYYHNGPALVKAIDACSNKGEIYEYMYHHMILPSVQLVKEGRYSEAVAHYKTFTQALQQQYK